jgi:putative ABC transport system substrate-binding protein
MKSFYLAVCAVLFALWSIAEGQQTQKVSRVGYLHSGGKADIETLRRELRELGYVEGQNVVLEYRDVEGKAEKFSELATELVRRNVDVIVAVNEAAARGAKNATQTIPIIMVRVGPNPVEVGLVESLARPGGNLTGLSIMAVEITGKRLELFKEAVPRITRVDALYDPTIRGNVQEANDVQSIGGTLGLSSKAWEIRGGDDLEKVFTALRKERPRGLYVPSGPTIVPLMRSIVDFAIRNRMPSVFTRRRFVELGGFMSYGYDQLEHYRRAAWYVDKILQGTKPADLPVEQPTKFELVINLKTAKQIGLTIPPNVLARADRVIR